MIVSKNNIKWKTGNQEEMVNQIFEMVRNNNKPVSVISNLYGEDEMILFKDSSNYLIGFFPEPANEFEHMGYAVIQDFKSIFKNVIIEDFQEVEMNIILNSVNK